MKAALASAQKIFGPRLVVAYASGSLAHGGFATAISDADLARVLVAVNPDPAEEIAQLRAHVADVDTLTLGQRSSMF